MLYESWHSGQKKEFLFNGRRTVIVEPETPLPGKPWLWRMEFFGAFPSVDIALLKAGYYVVYHSVSNRYGDPWSVGELNKFQDWVEAEYGLAKKPALYGMSRGGLYAVNYALAYPERTGLLYLDAPVLDIRSWPGRYEPSAREWKECLECYGLTEETVKDFRGTPLDRAEEVAGLNIPLITTITQGYSLYQVYKGRPLGWDYDLDEVAYWDGNRPGRSYWDSGRSFLKIILAGVLAVACIITLSNGQSAAIAPKHQGDMTVEQFVENFNDFRQFIATDGNEPSTRLTSDGTFEKAPQPSNVIVIDTYDSAPPLQFDFRTDRSGILKEVSFSYAVQGNTVAPIPLERMAAAVFSFLYGQPGIDQDELAQVHDEIIRLAKESPRSGNLSYHHSFTGAEADFQMTFQHFFFTSLGTLIPESEGQPSCEMSFSVCLNN